MGLMALAGAQAKGVLPLGVANGSTLALCSVFAKPGVEGSRANS